MQLSIFVDGADKSYAALMADGNSPVTEIRRDSTEAISEATVVFFHDRELSAYGVARYGQGRYAFRPREWQEIEIRDQADEKQFAGFITQIDQDSPPGEITKFACLCADYGILLDRIIINSTWPNGWADQNIILDAFSGQSEITVDGDDIAHISSELGAMEAKDISLRQLLENICHLTGGAWRVDYNRALHYYRAGDIAAPWGISDDPDEATTFPALLTGIKKDSSGLANRIVFLGGYDENGSEITAIGADTGSQKRYGVLSITITDRSVVDQETADLRAAAEVAQRAFPLRSGRAIVYKDGLDVGQTIHVVNREFSLNSDYLIRSVKIHQLSKEADGIDRPDLIYTEYEIEFGERQPDVVTQLRRLQNQPKQPTYAPVARPAPGSISVTNFASTIEPIQIVNSLPALPDPNYRDNAVILLTTDRKLYRRSGNTWTRAVNAADLVDQIQAGQLAADSVIAGTVAAGAIRAVDAAFDAAAIQSADINTLSASKLTAGTIDANVITVINLNASNITVGTMSGTLLANGTVGDIKIASGLSASKLTTGTLDASVVNVINLNAANITTGTLSATRITAGTITIGTATIEFDSLGIEMNGFASLRVGSSTYGPVGFTAAGSSTVSGSLSVSSFISATGSVGASSFTVGGNQVVGSRLSGISTVALVPFGSALTFTQGHENCISALVNAVNTIISRLQTHGLTS